MNALIYLAKNRERGPVPALEISTEQNIPRKFLESILTELRNARILRSKKGKNGGHLLNGAPEEINMAEVMRLFDGGIALLPCATYQYYEPCEECLNEELCGIRQVALEIRNETVKRLKKATLSEIIRRERELEAN